MWLAMALFFILPCVMSAEEPLRSIAEVRELSPERAAQNLKVDIEVQILKITSPGYGGFVTDGKMGIYMSFRHGFTSSALYSVGDRIRLLGYTVPGRFIPHIESRKITILENAPLPEALQIEEKIFFDPELDCQWVTFTGIVLGSMDAWHPTQMGIQLKYHEHTVNLLANRQDFSEKFIDSLVHRKVRVRAIAATKVNQKRQMMARFFHVAKESDLILLSKEEPNFVSIDELLSRKSAHQSQQVKVKGQVTHVSERGIYLRGEKGCLYSKTRPIQEIECGDLVEMVGLVEAGPVTPILFASDIRKKTVDDVVPPVPVEIELNEKYSPSLNYELVTLKCWLRKLRTTEDGLVFQCENSGYDFEVRIKGEKEAIDRFEIGSELLLTGIGELSSTNFFLPFGSQVDRFQLQLRNLQDIKVLSAPPWWSIKKLAVILTLMGLIGGAAFIWAMTLRSRIAYQTVVISEQVQRETVMEERQRLARDLHDTLQQNMTGISMQLAHAQRHVDVDDHDLTKSAINRAQEMLDQCRDETRESISRLRNSTTTRGSLAVLVEDTMIHDAKIAGVTLKIRTSGEPYPLDPFYVNHALKIVREAFSNALHHSECERIDVSFQYGEDDLEISVIDDGKGFDPKLGSPQGHYGLVGMNERAERIDSELSIESEPKKGTTIVLKIPVSLSRSKDL